MKNQPKLNSNKEVIAFLTERFPLCFTTEGEARPLKIGIFQELVERVHGEDNISKTQLCSALRLYTSIWRYLYGIKLGAQRVDLDGNPCGELETQHVEHARKQVRGSQGPRSASTRRPAGEETRKRRGRHASKPRPKQERPASAPRQTAPVVKTVPITDITTLQIGQAIKVKMGKNPMDATVIEIAKEWVRVQLSSGMALIVHAEHLQF